jgi:hypothetical protein
VPFPIGWDPNTGLGMPPGSFASSTMGQASPSASVPMANQQHVSASQLITQYTSATQSMGHNTHRLRSRRLSSRLLQRHTLSPRRRS